MAHAETRQKQQVIKSFYQSRCAYGFFLPQGQLHERLWPVYFWILMSNPATPDSIQTGEALLQALLAPHMLSEMFTENNVLDCFFIAHSSRLIQTKSRIFPSEMAKNHKTSCDVTEFCERNRVI